MIKGVPGLSRWFAVERPDGSTREEFRKASIQCVALLVGTLVAYLVREPLSKQFGIGEFNSYLYWIFGAMASGGSGVWNSLLDIVREVNRQKKITTEKLKAAEGAA
jgi:hypothetical protein